MDAITTMIDWLTDTVRAYRIYRQSEGAEMNRLEEKLARAAGVAQRQTTKIEARADRLIEREGEIEKRTDRAFVPHETILSDAERGLDAVERSLALLSNDPLGNSGESSQAGQVTIVRPGETVAPQQPVGNQRETNFSR